MPNDIYTQLKQHGLVLSQGTQLCLPPITPPKSNILNQLVSYIVPQQSSEHHQNEIFLIPILNNCFVIGRANTLICYQFEISKETSNKPIISRPCVNHLKANIDHIHICDRKYLSDRGQISFVVQMGDTLQLYYVDLKQNKLIEGNVLTYTHIESVRFISQKELLVLTSYNHSKFYVHHVFIQSGKIKEKSKMEVSLEIEENQVLTRLDLAGNIDEEQESSVCLFYYLKLKTPSSDKPKGVNKTVDGAHMNKSLIKKINDRNKSVSDLLGVKQSSQVLKVKQLQRDLNGTITQKKNYVVLNTEDHQIMPPAYHIETFDKYYCVCSPQEILIIKKKFDRYLFLDNIVEKNGGNSLKIHSKGVVTSQNGNSMELNMMFFGDPKCQSKLLDSLYIPNDLCQGFIMTWPFKLDKETAMMFAFRKEKRLVFCNLIKMDPYLKMLGVVQNTPKDKIPMVQEIAMNLGINRRDFYLYQWAHSNRELADVHQFLLPCGDISSIKKQLRLTLRKKKIQVSQLIKILQKLDKIIKSQLMSNLTQQLMIEYIKNDFLLRKIKLKQACRRIDFKQLHKIYNSSLTDMFVEIVKNDLYPEEKQQDPLHAMVQAPEKQDTSLKHVFQVFRIMILENYSRFLIRFVSEFAPDQIVKVFEKYYFLLPYYEFNPDLTIHEPEFMTEVEVYEMVAKRAKTQEQWFGDMTSVEFAREMSKQRLEQELHDFYPTSKINQAISSLINSDFGTKMKLHKHGLISCSMTEYRQKLKDISGIKLYLRICQHVNQYNLTQSGKDFQISSQLVQIFKTKNNLHSKAYQTVKLYTSIHRFMLRHDFFQKKKITTQELVQLTSEDLVALFFLQNKQRKQFIFKEFRQLFVQLYGGPKQFNQVINKFISSENCSRIQLEIFVNEIRSREYKFQFQNQQLLQIIIDGFCRKLQIRQQSDTLRFLQIMQQMQLTKKLAIKINKIQKIRQCLGVFVVFNLEKESYFNILKYEEGNQIFRMLLERYFNGELKENTVRIDDEDVLLEYCRNMLNVLLYLQDNVYYDVTQRDLMLCYCEVLIEWKQYEVIKGIVYEQEILEGFDCDPIIDRQKFVDDLVKMSIEKLYLDKTILFNEETKSHISEILAIYPEQENEQKKRQLAKLQLVEIFESWGIEVHTNNIYQILKEWNTEKETFIKGLIESFIHFMNFEIFSLVYRLLELGSGRDLQEINNHPSEEFIRYCLYYAERLLEKKIYDEIVKILAYVKAESDVAISYALVSETFLKSIAKKYDTEENADMGREAIEYFTQYFEDSQQIEKVFQTSFDCAQFEYMSQQRQSFILINPAYCFKRQSVNISLQMLWNLTFEVYKARGKSSVEILYSGYYFLLMIFRNPDKGYKIHGISYSLECLTDLMLKLQEKIDEATDLWCINIYTLFKRFMKSLYLEGLTRIKEVNPEAFKIQFSNRADETQLQAIKNRLKENREVNQELLRCITKVEGYVMSYKAVRKMERELKLEKIVMEEEQERQRQREERERAEAKLMEEQKQVQNNDDEKVTISLKKFNNMKANLSYQSSITGQFHTQKWLLQKIFQQQAQQKKSIQKNIAKPTLNNPLHYFLPTFMSNPNAGKETLFTKIQEDLKKEEWDKLCNEYSRDDLVVVMERAYFAVQRKWRDVVKIMVKLGLVDQRKIDALTLCNVYLENNAYLSLTSEELKHLMPFAYLIEPSQPAEYQFAEHFYHVIRQYFPTLLQSKPTDFLRGFAIFLGNLLNNPSYMARFCIDSLLLLNKNTLSPETIIRISTIMHLLRGFPQEVRAFCMNILQAFGENKNLLIIVKQQLLNILRDSGDYLEQELEAYIRDFGQRTQQANCYEANMSESNPIENSRQLIMKNSIENSRSLIMKNSRRNSIQNSREHLRGSIVRQF